METNRQQEFLRRIRQSLGRPGLTPLVDRRRLLGAPVQERDTAALGAQVEARAQEHRIRLLDRLEQELARVQGKVVRMESPQALEGYLADLVSTRNMKRVVRWDTPRLSEMDPGLKKVGAQVTAVGMASQSSEARASLREALIAADMGITEVDYAIAETGSLVLLTGQSQSRLVSLLPPVHVALLDPGVVVPTMADLLPVLAASIGGDPAQMRSAITFITGPSRTADIEKVVTVGIHGPMELHVLVLEYL